MTLAEHQPGDKGDKTYTTPQRVFHAFWWAVVWWLVGPGRKCVLVPLQVAPPHEANRLG